MAAKPWFKFYSSDWRGDIALRVCSIAARGLWLEMCLIMNDAVPRGYLTINGTPPSDLELAASVNVPADQISTLLAELESKGIFSRDKRGIIYSRKMLRDEKRTKTARKNGKRGGNPLLLTSDVSGCETDENSSLDNQNGSTVLKGRDKTQIPDARSQSIDISEYGEVRDSSEPSEKADRGYTSGYAFAGRVIRLTDRDFERWQSTYHTVTDLRAWLESFDGWLTDQADQTRKRWFHVASAALNKRHQENLASRQHVEAQQQEGFNC